MGFNKFLSIENLEIFSDCYVITEKIDGSNIQFIFDNGNMRIASRNTLVDENFSNCKSVIEREKFVNLFDKLKEMSKTNSINLYGEIYSNNIQKNIKYGKETNIKFFSIMIDGKYKSFKFLQEIIADEELLVPVICFSGSIEQASKFDIENFKSIVANNGEIAEGIIIQPYLYWDEHRIFKFKSKKFKEKSISKKVEDLGQDVVEYNKLFLDYLTDVRLKNTLSHFNLEGTDNALKREIVLEFIEDAKNDFEKDNDLSIFKKKELKAIYKFDFGSIMKRIDSLLYF